MSYPERDNFSYSNTAYVQDSYDNSSSGSVYADDYATRDGEHARGERSHYQSESRHEQYPDQDIPVPEETRYVESQSYIEENSARNVRNWLNSKRVSIHEPQHDQYFDQSDDMFVRDYSDYPRDQIETLAPKVQLSSFVNNKTYNSDKEEEDSTSFNGSASDYERNEQDEQDPRRYPEPDYGASSPFNTPPVTPPYNKRDEYMHVDELFQTSNITKDNFTDGSQSLASTSTDGRANDFHEINLSDSQHNSGNIPRKRLQKTFMTMRNAQQVAKQLGMIRDDEVELSENEMSEEEGSVNLDPPFKFVQRKCWAKACWSQKKHSHVLRRGVTRQRAKLLQSPTSGAGISAWDQQQQKAKKQVKSLWKETLTFLHIWNKPMKTIEGQYGTGVVSYFIFLRWLLYLNIAIFLMVFLLIVLPQVIDYHIGSFISESIENKSIPFSTMSSLEGPKLHLPEPRLGLSESPEDHRWVPEVNVLMSSYVSTFGRCTSEDANNLHCSQLYKKTLVNKTESGIKNLLDFLQGTGWMENTALFPGWYTPLVKNFLSSPGKYYNLSLAYILVTLVYFLLCLVMMVSYTTTSVRETLKTSEGHLHQYCNLVFGGWDYCIEESDTANRKRQSITQELRSNLAEERRRQTIAGWTTKKKLTVYLGRVVANILVLAILGGALYGIFRVCKNALDTKKDNMENFEKLMLEFSPSLTVTALNILLPIIFVQLVALENYAVNTEIKATLIRTVFVRLASVASLIGTIYVEVNCKEEDREKTCNYCNKSEDFRCWESYVGQQIYKLVILDFVVVFFTIFLMDFPRRLIVKHCSCKLAQMVGYQEFDIPKNVLDLVYSQTLCWLGTFFSPLLPAICLLKFLIFFYIKKLTLMVNFVPSKVPYRASRSNTFFIIVLMLSFVLSAVPVGFTIAQIHPSKGCGPFRIFRDNMWNAVQCTVQSSNNNNLKKTLEYLASAGFGVPVFIVLCLAIYYYSTVSEANHQMVRVLKTQLVLEGKDKQFLLARLTDVTKLHRLPNK